MRNFLWLLWSCLALVLSTPLTVAENGFGKRSMPTITLPYGTWQAAEYNAGADTFIFKNIRFAAPPTGNLRWEKPAPPAVQTGIQDGSYGFICTQSLSSALNQNSSAPSNPSPSQLLVSSLSAGNQSEDCLFLDVYVPSKALRPGAPKLPVIVWVYGGGYSAGSKDGAIALGLYDGAGPILSSGGNVIVVTFNYRLGAYGFLAGTTVEKEGVSNAGLHDQYAAFEWVQKYISLVGGDPCNVSAWGESAGAGSIYWLLTREGGTKDPLFRRAIIQSPAFQDKFDRNGTMEQDFQELATLAGCGGQGLACLRALNASVINAANNQLISSAPVVFNPAPDGIYFRQHATLEFVQGNYWKEIDSLIPSHVIDEAQIFVNSAIQTDAQFTKYLEFVWPPYAGPDGIIAAIEAEYPPVNSTNPVFKTEVARMKAVFAQETFLCSVNALTRAYAGKTYNVQFSALGGTHGSDVLPTWYDPLVTVNINGTQVPLWSLVGDAGLSKTYQSYLVSHAISGSPNYYGESLNSQAIYWPKVWDVTGQYFTNVLNVTDSGFGIITDCEFNKTICDFWVDIFNKTTVLGGYAPK